MTLGAMIRAWPMLTACAALAASTALAADVPAQAPSVQTVLDCRKIKDNGQRLACYDQTVDSVARATAAGDLVTMDREQRRTLRRQAFGFNLPSLSMFDRGEAKEENNRITSKVAAVSQDRNGAWIIRLEDGAVWIQTDGAVLYPPPKAGATAVIRRGAIGSFFMNIDGKIDFRATRRA
jgi:hypothetical protein